MNRKYVSWLALWFAGLVYTAAVAPLPLVAQGVTITGTGPTGTTFPSGDTISPLAVDANGDSFFVVSNGSTDTLYKQPAGGSLTALNASFPFFPSAVAVNSAGSRLYFIYGTGTVNSCGTYVDLATAAVSSGTTPANLPCGFNLSGYSLTYSDPTGLAVDANGDLFVADFGGGEIWELPGTVTSSSVPAQFIALTTGQPYDIAVNGGKLYVTAEVPSGSNEVNEVASFDTSSLSSDVPATATAPTRIVSNIPSIASGVAVTSNGTIYVGTGNGVEEVSGSTLVPVSGWTDADNSVAVDSAGTIFTSGTNSSGDSQINQPAPTAINFGSQAIGTASAASTLNFSISAETTIAGITVLTGGATGQDFALGSGSTCTAKTYASQTTCTVNVTFDPRYAGLRSGAVVFTNSSESAIATIFINGIGDGAQIGYEPGALATISASGLNRPYGVAVDAAGNTFIADTTNGRVVESINSVGTQVTVATGLYQPYGVAVDGADNLYVADTMNNRVVEVRAGSSSLIQVGNGFNEPIGVAVDGTGDIFVADTANNRIVEVTPAGVQTVIPTSGLNEPTGVAVDATGDVFIADYGNNRVVEVAPGGTQTTVANALSAPTSVVVDAAGDLFIVESGSNSVVEIPVGGGAQTTVASGLNEPYGLAMDGAGDLFVADSFNNRVLEVQSSQPPSLSFEQTYAGSTSPDSPKSVTVENIGNAALHVSSISFPSFSSTGFERVAGSGTPKDCGSSFSLASSASCNLSISFEPQTTGSFTGSVVLTDNNLNGNATTQSISLSGTGEAKVNQSISFSIPTNGLYTVEGDTIISASATSSLAVALTSLTTSVCTTDVSQGNIFLIFNAIGPCTIQATQAGNSEYNAATPVSQSITVAGLPQTITFPSLPTSAKYGESGPFTLSASASSNLPITYTVTGPATVSGTTLTLNGAGTVTVTASQAGNANYAAASPVLQTIAVTHGPSSIKLAVTSGGKNVPTVTVGSVVTLTATVKATSVPVTTGLVEFCNAVTRYCTDINLLGTAQLTSAGTATISFIPGIGNNRQYKAIFAGTEDAASSTSNSLSLNVTGKYPTTTAIAQSGNAGDYSLTATVMGTGSNKIGPGGSVSFLDASDSDYSLGSQSLGAVTYGQSFTNSATPRTGSGPTAVATADFNCDGLPDLAITNYNSNSVTILLGTGEGQFTAVAASPATGRSPNFIAVGDFNGDGKPDLVTANEGNGTATILLGNGDGTFTLKSSPATGNDSSSVAVADFNGDGIPDVAVANNAGNNLTILLGNGDGTFTAAASPSTGNSPYSVAVGDFNGDGKPDLVTANLNDNTVAILLGNGDGTFTLKSSPSTGSYPYFVTVADFNGDGRADLAVANRASGTVSILQGNGDGTFTARPTLSVVSDPDSIAVADFNQDGKADLTVTSQNGKTTTVLLGNGDGTFVAVADSPVNVGSSPWSVATADFNGDGVPDMAVANLNSNTATVLLTNLTATATASVSGISPDGSGTHNVEASYAGNSNFASSTSGTTALTAQAASTALTLSANPTSSTYGQQVTLTVTLNPYSSQNYSSNGETVTFYSGGVSLGTSTLSTGVATFNVSSLSGGTDSLTTSYAGDTYLAAATSAAQNFTVSPVSQTITFTGLPSTTTYGIAGPYALSGSASSNLAISYSVSGPANISGSTPTLAITGAGTVTVTASQAGNGNYTAAVSVSQAITVNPGVSASLNIPYVALTKNIPFGSFIPVAGSGGTAPLHYSISPNLSAGLSFNTATGAISGTPTAASLQAAYVVRVTDVYGAVASQAFTLTVNPAPTATQAVPSVVLTYNTLAKVTPVTSNGGTAPLTYSVAPALPAGLSFNAANGAITGTPTATAASATYTVTITDVNGAEAFNSFSLAVSPASQAITLAGLPATATYYASQAGPYTVSATASSSLPVTLSVSGPASLNGSALTIAGPGAVVVTASQAGNGNYTSASAAATLTVSAPSETLVNTTSLTTATVNVFGFGFAAPSGTLTLTDTITNKPVAAPVTLNSASATTALLPQVAVSTGTNTLPDWTVLGDVSGDGKPDLITSLYQTDSISVQLGNGDGTFQTATDIPITTGFGPAESHLFSLRGNGILDIVVGSFNTNQIAVLLGNGDGTFQSPAAFYQIGSHNNWVSSLTAGDFNHDGILDIATANTGDNTISILLGTGDGKGGLALQSTIAVGRDPEAIRAGDFNGDGYPDLAVANYNAGTVTTLLNSQNGTFTASTLSVGSGKSSGPQALAMTGSGSSLLLAVTNYHDNTVSVFNSNGNGTFGGQTTVPVGHGPDDVNFADFNGDGIADLVVANYTDGTVDLVLGKSSGGYALAVSFPVGSNPYSAAVGDIDLDGTPDVIVSNCFSNSTGTLLSGTQIAVPYTGLSLTPGDTIQAVFSPSNSSSYATSTSADASAQ